MISLSYLPDFHLSNVFFTKLLVNAKCFVVGKLLADGKLLVVGKIL